jgi:hypothetical protein
MGLDTPAGVGCGTGYASEKNGVLSMGQKRMLRPHAALERKPVNG